MSANFLVLLAVIFVNIFGEPIARAQVIGVEPNAVAGSSLVSPADANTPVDINATGAAGNTYLHRAINSERVNLEIIKLAISKGVDVNTKNNNGETSLHRAALMGNRSVVELLLINGAKIDLRDNAGRTPLHYVAGAGGRIDQKEKVDIIDLLLNSGADINATDKLKWTPLHYAAYRLRRSTVEFLINKGADVNIEDKRGRTAFLVVLGRPAEFRGLQGIEPYLTRIQELKDFMRGDGHVYYVSPSGNDSSSGSLQHPFRTLNAAISYVEPGDTIFVRSGIFRCSSSICIDKSGKQNRPIRLMAYYGESPVFDFSKASEDGIVVTGAYWHIKGLTIARAYGWGMKLVSEEAHHNILERV